MNVQDCTEFARYQLVLSRGEQVIETITTFSITRNIIGASFTGIGAVANADIAYYDLTTKQYLSKKYIEDREVISLIGNISLVDSKPFVHAHIALGDSNMQVVGGHLKEARVAVTLEINLVVYNEPFNREFHKDIGLNLIN